MKKFAYLIFGAFSAISVFLIQPAQAQNINRIYTNNLTCAAVKQAVKDNKKVLLRFRNPGSPVISYDLFYVSRLACEIDEEAVSPRLPCVGGPSKIGFQCVKRLDENDNEEAPTIVEVQAPANEVVEEEVEEEEGQER